MRRFDVRTLVLELVLIDVSILVEVGPLRSAAVFTFADAISTPEVAVPVDNHN